MIFNNTEKEKYNTTIVSIAFSLTYKYTFITCLS